MRLISKYYDLTMDAFIKAYCENDLSVLGEGSEIDRAAAWENIFNQYCDALCDEKHKSVLNLQLQIKSIELKRQRAILYLDCLGNIIYHNLPNSIDPFVSGLKREAGMSLPFPDNRNEEEVQKWFQFAATKVKGLIRTEKELADKLDCMQPGGNGKPNRDHFEGWLGRMSATLGYVDAKEVTVSRYCSFVREYCQEALRDEMKQLARIHK